MKTWEDFRDAIARVGAIQEHWGESDFASRVLPDLVESLGYKQGELLFEKSGDGFKADAVLAPQRDIEPWVMIETKIERDRPKRWTFELMRDAMKRLGCENGLYVSPTLIAVVTPEILLQTKARAPEAHVVETAFELLSRAAQKRKRRADVDGEGYSDELIEAISKVEKAQLSQEKGSSLEDLANLLLNGTRGLSVKYRNLRTRTSEIDLVIEYHPHIQRIPALEDIGRYFLVECKNWSKPVGASNVRDFIGKLEACRVNLGLVFSKNGITGENSGGDGVGTIRKHFDQFGRIVLVIALDDLRSMDQENFGVLLDRKLDLFRFDVGS